jgi:hypothetical protein
MIAALGVAAVGVAAFVLALALGGCHARGELAAPCDSLTLTGVAAECRASVSAKCARSDAGVVDETCPTLRECDARIRAWRECDGGVGAGGAP